MEKKKIFPEKSGNCEILEVNLSIKKKKNQRKKIGLFLAIYISEAITRRERSERKPTVPLSLSPTLFLSPPSHVLQQVQRGFRRDGGEFPPQNMNRGEWEASTAVEFAMSLSCSDCFSDLLCGEASSSIICSGGGGDSPEYSSDFDSRLPDEEEFIAGLLEDERDLARIGSCRPVGQPIDAPVRSESVAWILKVCMSFPFFQIPASDFRYRAR